MKVAMWRKVRKGIRNLPNLFQGYNIYVNRDKLRLITMTFRELYPGATSFADLGGVWNVNAAYTQHTLKTFPIKRSVLVDTDYPPDVRAVLKQYPNLEVMSGDFSSKPIVDAIGCIDVVFLFDVLLHQANPDWNEVLERYSKNCS